MSLVWAISPSSVRWRFWLGTAPSRDTISCAASPVTGSWVSVLFLQICILHFLGFQISPSLLCFQRVPIRQSRRPRRPRSSAPLRPAARACGPPTPALKRTPALPSRSRAERSPSPHLYLQGRAFPPHARPSSDPAGNRTDSRTGTPLWTPPGGKGTRQSHDRQ